MYLFCIIYEIFGSDIIREIWFYVREMWGEFVMSYVWEPCLAQTEEQIRRVFGDN